MKNAVVLTVMACGLAACGADSGTGFAGIGTEPASVSREQSATLSGGSSYSSLAGPVVQADSNPRRAEKQARAAFAAPAADPLQIRLAGETVQMNLVDVRGQRYAVLRPVGSQTLSSETARAFGPYARALTGCVQAGPYYADKGAAGAATALACG